LQSFVITQLAKHNRTLQLRRLLDLPCFDYEHPACALYSKCLRSLVWGHLVVPEDPPEDDSDDSEEGQKRRERRAQAQEEWAVLRLQSLFSVAVAGESTYEVLRGGKVSAADLVNANLPRAERLRQLAITRLCVEVAAEVHLARQKGSGATASAAVKKLQDGIIEVTNGVLGKGPPEEAQTTRVALRMLFLKELFRAKGTSFVQKLFGDLMATARFPWLVDWKYKDARVKHFLRKQHLISFDPFTIFHGYEAVRKATRAAVDGATDQLAGARDSFQGDLARWGVAQLHALFQEVATLYTTESGVAKNREAIARIGQWLGAESQLPPNLAAFLQGFTKPAFGLDKTFKGGAFQWSQFLALSPGTDQKQMLQLQCMCRAAGLGFAAKDSKQYRFFFNFVSHPEGNMGLFLPAVASDNQLALMQVLGGGWYECSNGHAYYVDQCGRPTEKLKCATCGEDIGGLDHELLASNRTVNKVDKSLPGYIVNLLDKAGIATSGHTERDLSPVSFRVSRFIMHACMFLCLATLGEGGYRKVDALVRMQSSRNKSPPQIPDGFETGDFLYQHLQRDWAVLCSLTGRSDEEMALLLHFVMNSLEEAIFAKTRNEQSEPASVALLTSTAARNVYEADLQKTHISPVINASKAYLKNFHDRYEEDNTSLLALLREAAKIEKIPREQRLQDLMSVLSRGKYPTLKHLRNELHMDKMNSSGGARYPILQLFLQEEEKLRALRFLPEVLEWLRLLYVKYDRRIDRETARQKTVQNVLDEVPKDERRYWEASFEKYAMAWNYGWKFVENYGCLEIPAELRLIVMSSSTPICFSLPHERDEGICPLAFVQNLITTQNQFLDRLYRLVYRSGVTLEEPSLAPEPRGFASVGPSAPEVQPKEARKQEKQEKVESPEASPAAADEVGEVVVSQLLSSSEDSLSSSASLTSLDSSLPMAASQAGEGPAVLIEPVEPSAEEDSLMRRFFSRFSRRKKTPRRPYVRAKRVETPVFAPSPRERVFAPTAELEPIDEYVPAAGRDKGKGPVVAEPPPFKDVPQAGADASSGTSVDTGEPAAQAEEGRADYFENDAYVDVRVPTHLLTHDHLIAFDADEQLPGLVQIYSNISVYYGRGAEVSYNFAAIQQYLMDHVLLGKPFIDLELPKFSFANEGRQAGYHSVLRDRIPQIELSDEVKEKIREELSSPQYLHECMEVLEVVLGFLASMGGTHVRTLPAKQFLVDYMKNTLSMAASPLYATKTISSNVQLQHLLSLWNVLDDILTVDPFANVMSRYKVELTEEHVVALQDAAPHLDLGDLLPAMKDFMQNYLQDNATMGPKYPLKGTLGVYTNAQQDEFEELDWYQTYFPEGDLLLENILHTYLFLSDIPH